MTVVLDSIAMLTAWLQNDNHGLGSRMTIPSLWQVVDINVQGADVIVIPAGYGWVAVKDAE